MPFFSVSVLGTQTCSDTLPTMSQTFAIPPQPGEAFKTRDELLSNWKSWGAAHGYAPVITSSSVAEERAYIGCDRGGTYCNTWGLNNSNQKRNRGRVANGCPFKIRAKCRNGIWASVVLGPLHNHDASKTPDVHSTLRTMAHEQLNRVASLNYASASASTITTFHLAR
jgi:hypothetical protein